MRNARFFRICQAYSTVLGSEDDVFLQQRVDGNELRAEGGNTNANMDEELTRLTQLKSDEELYEMLYCHREDWMPEALEAAEREWQSRNLDDDKLKEIQEVAAENERERAAIAEEPLSHAEKIVFFVFNFAFCAGIAQAIIADTIYRNRGYERKFWDCFKWMAYGLLFYGVIIGACHWIPFFLSALQEMP